VGCQCTDLLNPSMLDNLAFENQTLEQQLAAEKSSKKTQILSDAASVQKYKFDNQILMRKLSDYKKAEKGAMQIVGDYEEMKMKYFKVLKENESQKKTIQANIQKDLDQQVVIDKVNKEKQSHVDELYRMRQDVERSARSQIVKDERISLLEKNHNELIQKAANFMLKEKEFQML
jgi:hypothetical protein